MNTYRNHLLKQNEIFYANRKKNKSFYTLLLGVILTLFEINNVMSIHNLLR